MTVTCIYCGPKEACLFAPSEMKKRRPICRQCRAKMKAKYYIQPTGRGKETWRQSMRGHFLEGGRAS